MPNWRWKVTKAKKERRILDKAKVLPNTIEIPEDFTLNAVKLFWRKKMQNGVSCTEKEFLLKQVWYLRSIWKTPKEICNKINLWETSVRTLLKELDEKLIKILDKNVKELQCEAIWRLDWVINKLYDTLEETDSPQWVAQLMRIIQQQEELRAKIWWYFINKIDIKENRIDEFLNKI